MIEECCPICGSRLVEIEGVYVDIMSCTNCKYDETMIQKEVDRLKNEYNKRNTLKNKNQK